MSDKTQRRGGGFLIEETPFEEITTPEDFSQETQLLAQTCRDFVAQEVLPVLDRLNAHEPGLMRSLLEKAGEIGLLSVDVPENYGGLGAPKVQSMVVAESIGAGSSFPVAHGAQTGIGTLPIVYFGTPEQKQKWLPKLATGEVISAYALTEAGSGSDALAAKATAVLDGDEWVLNGEKTFTTNGGFSDITILFAKVDGEKFSAFIVPMDTPGVSVGEEEHKMGINGSSTVSVIMQDARIPKENLLGEVGRGHVIAFNILDVGRFKLGASVVGASKEALKETIGYTTQRQQFGKALSDFPLSRYKLGYMASRIYAAESAVYRTAGLFDEAIARLDHDAEDFDRNVIKAIDDFAIECSIIKVFASEVLDHVVDEMVQLYGGYGYVEDYPASRYYRDSRINRIFEGTNEINRMLIPGMILKRAMKGDLPLLAAAKAIQDELLSIPSLDEGGEKEPFEAEMEQVGKLKKAVLLVAGVAAQKLGAHLQDEQEVLVHTADMIMETYALESAVLRARKMIASGKEIPVVQAMITVLVNDAVERAGRAGRAALTHVADGDELNMMLVGLRRFTKVPPVDIVDAARVVAASAIDNGGYRVPA